MNQPVTPIPSSTLMLIREGRAGLETLLLLRHDSVSLGGATVFPGGKIDPLDLQEEFLPHCHGLEELTLEESGTRIAAIREAFEETGILLARDDRGKWVDSDRSQKLEKMYGAALRNGTLAMGELARIERIYLACDALILFAHWITPEIAPKRFDTQFFLAEAPAGCQARHDDQESVEVRWMKPSEALDLAETGERKLVFPTRMNLAKLGRHSHIAEALKTARQSEVLTIQMTVRESPEGMMLCLPPEADYDVKEILISQTVDLRKSMK